MEPIRVQLPKGQLIYQNDEWQSDGASKHDLTAAQRISLDYTYSPADGYPGCALAMIVAQRLGGKAILPDFPPVPKDAVP